MDRERQANPAQPVLGLVVAPILLGFPVVGRIWCSFCPFMVWGEISQRIAGKLGWQPRRWPRGDHDRWASPLLAWGFAAILLWEELFHLETTAWLNSCLLLLITAGAVVIHCCSKTVLVSVPLPDRWHERAVRQTCNP